jgi:hypothetical protein
MIQKLWATFGRMQPSNIVLVGRWVPGFWAMAMCFHTLVDDKMFMRLSGNWGIRTLQDALVCSNLWVASLVCIPRPALQCTLHKVERSWRLHLFQIVVTPATEERAIWSQGWWWRWWLLPGSPIHRPIISVPHEVTTIYSVGDGDASADEGPEQARVDGGHVEPYWWIDKVTWPWFKPELVPFWGLAWPIPIGWQFWNNFWGG